MEQNQNIQISVYQTPFNVGFFDPQPKNFFEEYVRRVLALPESIQNLMMAPSSAEFIEENLGPQFNLSAEQKRGVTRIIRDILLGDVSINEMASKISEKLGIDPTTAYQVQGKIVSELFGPAMGEIRKRQKEEPPQEPPAAPQPYRPPVRSNQPQYIPPPPRSQNPTTNPGNVVDLRNGNN